MFCFNAFTISAEPGTNNALKVYTSIIETPDDTGTSSDDINDTLAFDIKLRDCVSGEKYVNGECHVCPEGTYSIELDSDSCDECPSGATCYGNNTLVP